MQGAAPKRTRARSTPGSISPAAVPLNGVTSCAATLSRPAPRTVGAPGAPDRLGDRGHLDVVGGGRLGGLGELAGGAQHLQDAGGHLGDPIGRHHRVDQAFGVEVLGDLDARRERLAVQGLVDPRPEEADQRPRLGGGHVTERPPEASTPPVVGCRR